MTIIDSYRSKNDIKEMSNSSFNDHPRPKQKTEGHNRSSSIPAGNVANLAITSQVLGDNHSTTFSNMNIGHKYTTRELYMASRTRNTRIQEPNDTPLKFVKPDPVAFSFTGYSTKTRRPSVDATIPTRGQKIDIESFTSLVPFVTPRTPSKKMNTKYIFPPTHYSMTPGITAPYSSPGNRYQRIHETPFQSNDVPRRAESMPVNSVSGETHGSNAGYSQGNLMKRFKLLSNQSEDVYMSQKSPSSTLTDHYIEDVFLSSSPTNISSFDNNLFNTNSSSMKKLLITPSTSSLSCDTPRDVLASPFLGKQLHMNSKNTSITCHPLGIMQGIMDDDNETTILDMRNSSRLSDREDSSSMDSCDDDIHSIPFPESSGLTNHVCWTDQPHFLNPEYFKNPDTSLVFHPSTSSSELPADIVSTTILTIESPRSLDIGNYGREEQEHSIDYFSETFEVLEVLGNGSFANVFKVMDRKTDQIYAIKRTTRPFIGFSDRARKIQEAETMWQLGSHANCLSLIGCWEQRGHLYLQLEYCDGGSLHNLIHRMVQQEQIISESSLWNLIYQIGQGLKYIHSKGFVHLDIKPENILVTLNGWLKISDFGLTRFIGTDDDNHFHELDMEGDKVYMAPELLDEQPLTKCSDIFSLGLILLELAANIELPSQGDAWRALRMNQFQEIHIDEHISYDLIHLIFSMLHSDPSQRPSLDYILDEASMHLRLHNDSPTFPMIV